MSNPLEKLLEDYWNKKTWYQKLFCHVKWKIQSVQYFYYDSLNFISNLFSILPVLWKIRPFDYSYTDDLMLWYLKRLLSCCMEECTWHKHNEDIDGIKKAIEFLEWRAVCGNDLMEEYPARLKQYHQLLVEKSGGWWC